MTAPAVSPAATVPSATVEPPRTVPEAPVGFDDFLARASDERPRSVGLAHMLDHFEHSGVPNGRRGEAIDRRTGDLPDVRTRGIRGTATGVERSVGPGPSSTDHWGVAALRPEGAVDDVGGRVLAAGERYLGVPYRWGGTDPATGFDCSGFVQQVYADLGVSLPRVSIDQSRQGSAVADLGSARVGDLVFWYGTGDRPNHIGIYAGQGRMLVAPRTGDVVRYQEISRTPHEIRRVV